MGEAPPDPPAPIHVAWTLSEADAETSSRITWKRLADAYGYDANNRYFHFAIIGILCIVAGLLAVEAGTVRNVRDPFVPLLCAVVYCIGRWIDEAMQARRWKRERAEIVGRAYEATISATGVALNGPDERYACGWSKFRSIRIVDGFVVFWIGRQGGIYVPVRAFAEDDLPRIRAFAPEALVRADQA